MGARGQRYLGPRMAGVMVARILASLMLFLVHWSSVVPGNQFCDSSTVSHGYRGLNGLVGKED